MRIKDILGTIQNNFSLALILVTILGLFIGVGYFIIYKWFLKGEKEINKRRLILWFAFTGYMIMILAFTFLNRSNNRMGSTNLHFLSTYREAWNTFSFTNWSFIILNIFMLLPFGFLLPLLNKRFQKLIYTFGASFLLTLGIETTQLITSRGSFLVDDIFNNILGAIIGYGIVMAIITFKESKNKKSIVYLAPLIVTIMTSLAIFAAYESKEFGNLNIGHNYKVNMKNIDLSINTHLTENPQEVRLNHIKYNINNVPIYKAKIYDRDKGKEFFINFLGLKDIDDQIEINSYNDMDIYSFNGEKSYNMWFYYKGGNYEYTDFSSLNEGVEKMDTDKDTLLKKLGEFNIRLDDSADYIKYENDPQVGFFIWDIDNHVEEDYITNGSLRLTYYDDDSIKNIDNNIIRYKKIRDITIKSTQEALKEFQDGKFNLYDSNNIKNIDIEDISLSYMMDSKGYYQPIYKFKIRADRQDLEIVIPAIKK